MSSILIAIVSFVLITLVLLILLALIIKVLRWLFRSVGDRYSFWGEAGDIRRYNEDKAKLIREQMSKTIEVENSLSYQDIDQIVDIAKPQGRWTDKVIKEKLRLLLAMREIIAEEKAEGNEVSYWKIWSRAHDRVTQREKGKGR